jgi:hypothetical protein
MRIAILAHKQKFIFAGAVIVIAVLCCLVSPFIQFSFNWTKRFVDGQYPFGGYQIHDPSHMPLPSVVIEPGPILCCRMEQCNFRFPLPKEAGAVTNDPVSRGFDTIKGAIYVTNADGGAVNLPAYRRRFWEDSFRVYMGADFMFTAGSPDGGSLEVENSGHATKIAFSFFGDY